MKKTLLLMTFLFTMPATASDDALAQCRLISAVEERVSCYDSFVDSRSPKVAKTIPDAQSLFGTSDAEAKRIVATTLDIEQITNVESAVADVRLSANRKLTVVLDNGQVWRQLGSQRLNLKSGDAVVVSQASLGSYQMEKKSGSRKIRVKRVQ